MMHALLTPLRRAQRATRHLPQWLIVLALAGGMALEVSAQLPGQSASNPTGVQVPNSAVAAAAALEALPRVVAPPAERIEVLPEHVQRWRLEGRAHEYGDAGITRDALRAAEFYCRAARYGDAEAQFSLGWMYTNGRGIERNDAAAAHLFAAAAEQEHLQARNMATRLGTPVGPPPACLRPPEADVVAQAPVKAETVAATPATPAAGQPSNPLGAMVLQPHLAARVPPQVLNFVRLMAPVYKLDPNLVLAVIAQESNFNAGATSHKNAQGLMQLIPDTARRFGVSNSYDPAQNIRGGMAYLRWLLAYFEGDVSLALAGYNAGEGAVDKYLGVPPYAETRNYVLKILISLQGKRNHPYDPAATQPSGKMALMRNLWSPAPPRRGG